MRFVRLGPMLIVTMLLLSASLLAQNDKMTYASFVSTKFGNLPVLPKCMTIAAQHGDPFKEAAAIAAKFTSGCVVPWHWHTAAENIILLSGKGKIEMKDGMSHTVSAGDYLYLPAKQAHQFTCTMACRMYDLPDGAFDIHYIDKDGKEIQPDEALKSGMKTSSVKSPAKASAKK
jgi:mannose-6-phosphate isomerase-like protein (cupin superfamily)